MCTINGMTFRAPLCMLTVELHIKSIKNKINKLQWMGKCNSKTTYM